MLPNPKPPVPRPAPVVYPESDGKPMSDNTKQFRWIVVLYNNLEAIFHARLDVFVSGNQFWYPVEGHPEIVQSPDVYVVFGRPKGDRPSYKQWEEDNVPMTVVFEVLSPSNTVREMDEKQIFYEEHGVEEYYMYDPESNRLAVWVRHGDVLLRVRRVNGFVSPRLGIRFDLSGPELVVHGPDGQRFLSFDELKTARDLAQQQVEQAQQQVEQARRQAEQARLQAEQAQLQAEQARLQAEQAQLQAARLSELSRKARRGLASTEELQELEELENRCSHGAQG